MSKFEEQIDEEEVIGLAEQEALEEDSQVSAFMKELLKIGYEVHYKTYEEELCLDDEGEIIGDEQMVKEFTFMKIMAIRHQEEVVPEFALVQRDYPALFQFVADLAAELEKADSEAALAALESTYIELMGDPDLYGSRKKEFQKYIDDVYRNQFKVKRITPVIDEDGTILPYQRETPKIGRNDPCPCGSGKKYKKCCGRN